MSPLIRISCSRNAPDLAYVSFDGGKSWLVVHPDGTTTMQFRAPLVPLVFGSYICTCAKDQPCAS